MERLVSGPLKAGGWVMLGMAFLAFRYNDLAVSTMLFAVGIGALMIWAGRWVSASRSARLGRYDDRHWERAEKINGH